MDPNAGQVPTGTDDGQVPSANPQAGQANPTQVIADDGAPQAGDDVSKKVRKANEEAARYRTELRQAQDELKRLQDSLKTDEQKREERFKALEVKEATWRETERRLNRENAIALAVAKASSADPDVLAMLLDRAELDIDDATGRPLADSLGNAIKSIFSEKPYLVKQDVAATAQKPVATSAGASTNAQRQHTTAITREAIMKMTDAEIVAAMESGEIPKAMEAGLLGSLYTRD